ncbi:DUF4265 domain-containing protein [Halioxenophilus aromaticivorans]|uniref:DUF4265 domain-containing protein n=1 Tax=Halioxenophilus aromaticivorans TaxID=1306992 RepID=A0AAV3TX06_9ALTE
MQALQVIELFAGTRPDGQAVVEQLRVKENADNTFTLVTSPAFVQGIARGDTISKEEKSKEFNLVQRGGNLCIRVYSRDNTEALCEAITPALEKLGGDLDVETDRLLVYSIHVSCGFTAIEDVLNKAMAKFTQAAWVYGNVYDPADGTTPLNWWQAILAPE